MPALAMAAAAWSWVEKILQLDHCTWKRHKTGLLITDSSEVPDSLDRDKKKPWELRVRGSGTVPSEDRCDHRLGMLVSGQGPEQ